MSIMITETDAKGKVRQWTVENQAEFIRAINVTYDTYATSYGAAKKVLRDEVGYGVVVAIDDRKNT